MFDRFAATKLPARERATSSTSLPALKPEIYNFNPGNDILDLARTLAGTGIAADMSNITSYLSTTSSGGNTVLSVDPTGGHGAATAIATIMGKSLTLATMVADHDFKLS